MTTPRVMSILLSVLLLTTLQTMAQPEAAPPTTPLRSGPENPRYAPLDDFVEQLTIEGTIPGAVLALAKNGTVVHWQGFGWADREQHLPATADTLFRIASVSKSITAVVTLKLVESGKLSLETTLAALLPELTAAAADVHIPEITVRQLLQHSAGWDDGDHDEVALRNDVRRLARLTDPGAPVSPADLINRRFKRPLDFLPGSDHAYSNFGYVVLGRIVERVCDKSYLDALQDLIFNDLGQSCTLVLSEPLPTQREAKETRYYDYPGASLTEAAVLPGQETAWPDGGIATTTLDAALGCAMSAPCLALFIDKTFAALDGRPGLLSEAMAKKALERPAPPLWVDSDAYYGLGWRVDTSKGQAYIWHGGSMPGTEALAARTANGTSIAILMNSRPQDWQAFNDALQAGVQKLLE